MKAAEKGHEKVAEQLIALNAELNLQNSVRSTHNFSFIVFHFYFANYHFIIISQFSYYLLIVLCNLCNLCNLLIKPFTRFRVTNYYDIATNH
jgi:hypothetical protein